MDYSEIITYKKILIINLGGIGDILLSVPALRALHDKHAEARVYLLVVPRVAAFLESIECLSFIDRVFILNKNIWPQSLLHNLQTLLTLRKMKIDMALNMRTIESKGSALKLKILLRLIKPKVKAGRDTEGRGKFLDLKIDETDIGQKHEMQYYIESIKTLGLDAQDNDFCLKIRQKDTETIQGLLKNKGIRDDDFVIGIHPGGMPSRRWPLENFAYVVSELSKRFYAKFVVTAGENEVDLAQRLIGISKAQPISLGGEVELRCLGALIKRLGLLITNDTGTMHIAAVLKTPMLAIFGPGDLTRYDPRKISDKAFVIYKQKDCAAPCNRFSCISKKCLKAVLPQEVADLAASILEKERCKSA